MENLTKEHKEKFGVEPIIIGLYWYDKENEIKNIEKSIKDNKPYNEYELLSDSEKKAYDKGELLF